MANKLVEKVFNHKEMHIKSIIKYLILLFTLELFILIPNVGKSA